MSSVSIITVKGLYQDEIPNIQSQEQQGLLKEILGTKECDKIPLKKGYFIGMYIGFNDFNVDYFDEHDSKKWDDSKKFDNHPIKEKFDELNKNKAQYTLVRIKDYE